MTKTLTYLVCLPRCDTVERKYYAPVVYVTDGDFFYVFNPVTRKFHWTGGAANDFLFGNTEWFSSVGENLWFAVSEDEACGYAAMMRADDLTPKVKELHLRYAERPILPGTPSVPPEPTGRELLVRPKTPGL